MGISFFFKGGWHVQSTFVLAIDEYKFYDDPWSIDIESKGYQLIENFSEVIEHLLEQAKRHFVLAQEINLENPLHTTPYQSLYAAILEIHQKTVTAETQVAIEDELETIRKEYRRIRDALKPEGVSR